MVRDNREDMKVGRGKKRWNTETPGSVTKLTLF